MLCYDFVIMCNVDNSHDGSTPLSDTTRQSYGRINSKGMNSCLVSSFISLTTREAIVSQIDEMIENPADPWETTIDEMIENPADAGEMTIAEIIMNAADSRKCMSGLHA